MLFELLITSGVDFFINILSSLNDVAFLNDFTSMFLPLLEYIKEIISFAYFFLPIQYMIPLFSVVFGIIAFRIIVALINFIVTLVPIW